MFEQVYDSLRTATESGIHMQQEMFKTWVGMWPGFPAATNGSEPFRKYQQFQKKWAEFVAEMVKKQREVMEAQFSAGMKNIEEAFRLGEIKDPEEMRARTIELWQKSFECFRKLFEAQLRDFQATMAKWTEPMMKEAVTP
jgi:hypothetical protein